MNQTKNINIFSQANVVSGYAKQSHLHHDEESVLNELIPVLPQAKMLDIGVGGGRTTIHYAKWTREYVGTDYVDSMIDSCEHRFKSYPDNISFKTCDARSMHDFQENYFDIIFFSFNGIDCVSHTDRMDILKEISRVGKSGGYFYFSAHNLNWAYKIFEWWKSFTLNPKRFLKFIKMIILRYTKNHSISLSTYRSSNYLIFNDGAHHWTLNLYYIKPKEQIKQLQEYFYDVRVFSTEDGNEIKDLDLLEKNKEPYLGYLCRIK